MCGLGVVPGQKRCAYHAEQNLRYTTQRQAKERAEREAMGPKRTHAEALAAYHEKPAPVPPEGTNPTQCAPFKPHAVDNTRRTDCARAKQCRDYAIKARWNAFSCQACSVRETVKDTVELRRGGDVSASLPARSIGGV